MALVDVLVAAGSATTALLVILGVVWWLIGPRVAESIRELTGVAHTAHRELSGEKPDSVAAHAATAARAAAQLPELRKVLDELVRRTAEYDAQRIPERLTLVELAQENSDRRLGGVEQALIAQLGADLVRERSERRERHHEART